MQEPTKKRHIDEGLVTIRLRVHPNNAEKIKEYARSIETGSERNYSVAETFPEYIGKEMAKRLGKALKADYKMFL